MPVIKHTHQYILRTTGKGGNKLYFCSLPDCSHFMPWLRGVINKSSICWECLDEFLITADIVAEGIVKPRCPKCRGKLKEQFGDILDGVI